MGTRADFYVGSNDRRARWVGSVAYDGDPMNFRFLLKCRTAREFRAALTAEFRTRDDATFAKDGWPWPWDDSNTTDYAYRFSRGNVWVSDGAPWVRLCHAAGPAPRFPSMGSHRRAAPVGSARSGMMVVVA